MVIRYGSLLFASHYEVDDTLDDLFGILFADMHYWSDMIAKGCKISVL